MPEIFDKRARAQSYRRAVLNEIAVDETMYRAINKTPESLGYLPRVSAAWPRLKRAPSLATVATRLASAAWRLGLYAPFFLGQSLVQHLSRTRQAENVPAIDRLEFSMSRLAPALLVPDKTQKRIRLTRDDLADDRDRVKTFTPGSVLSDKETFAAMLEAISLSFTLIYRDRHIRRWAMQTYTCFEWVLIARTLQRMRPKRIVMANHCDRWAILADDYARAAGVPLTIVQHGLEAKRHLPSRIRSATALVTFSEEEAQLFRDYVLAPEASVDVSIRAPSLKTTPLPQGLTGTPVLVIGHPNFDAAQIEIARRYSEDPNVVVFYKPHPTVSAVAPEIAARCVVWEQPDTFPDVPVVVSYYSTLALEYQLAGSDVHIHGYGVGPADFEAIDRLIETHKTKGRTIVRQAAS